MTGFKSVTVIPPVILPPPPFQDVQRRLHPDQRSPEGADRDSGRRERGTAPHRGIQMLKDPDLRSFHK